MNRPRLPSPPGHQTLVWVALGTSVLAVFALALLLASVSRTGPDDDAGAAGAESAAGRAGPWTDAPYEGYGTWVDVFDAVPAYSDPTAGPAIRPAHVHAMAGAGVETLYLQAATSDSLAVIDPAVIGAFLTEAHEAGLDVVAWYLPRFDDLDADAARLAALAAFEVDGHRFDGLALDIEWTQGVADPAERSRRLVELSQRLETIVDGQPLGAIVPPPVQLEDVNPAFWPGFPWAELEGIYEVWLPMTYWTLRLEPWDDPFLFTDENIRRVRANTGNPDAKVHVIGGVADTAAEGEYPPFMRAAGQNRAHGYSVYDWRTLTGGAQARLMPDSAAEGSGAAGSTPADTTVDS